MSIQSKLKKEIEANRDAEASSSDILAAIRKFEKAGDVVDEPVVPVPEEDVPVPAVVPDTTETPVVAEE